MSYDEMRDYENKVNEYCDYFISRPDLIDHQPRPLFFYHLMKTGGMTLDLVLRNNLSLLEQSLRQTYNDPSFRAPICARIDNKTSGIETPNQIDFMFLCGHLKFGVHHLITTPIDTLAIFREPYSRTLSEYTYRCMREGKVSTEEEFSAFLDRSENTNAMCKMMCKSEHEWSLEEAIANMDELTYVGLTSDLREIIEYYLSSFGLPNVLTQKLNATLPEYQLKNTPYKDKYYELNQEDVALYQHAKDTRRLPSAALASEAISDLTTILYEEVNSDLQLHVKGKIFPTETIVKTLVDREIDTLQTLSDKITNM